MFKTCDDGTRTRRHWFGLCHPRMILSTKLLALPNARKSTWYNLSIRFVSIPPMSSKQLSGHIEEIICISPCKWATKTRPRPNSNSSIPFLIPFAIMWSIIWTISCPSTLEPLTNISLFSARYSTSFAVQKFFVNRKKTKLYIPHDEPLNILGVDIQNGEITPEISKVEAFNALPSPQSFQELGKTLGSFTWLSRTSQHRKNWHHLCTNCSTANVGYWTDTHENALQEMKKLVMSRKVRRPMPLISNPGQSICLRRCFIGRLRWNDCRRRSSLETAKPVLFHSRVFNPAQSNYPTHEQELLAVVDLLKTYYHLMAGREFTLLTDSQAMTAIFSQKHLSPRQARWMLFLGQFPMKIEHIPGETNVIADLLSRIPEYSGYISGSLSEPVDVELPDQEFESSTPPLPLAAPITLRRGKVLLETPVTRRRGPQSQKPQPVDHRETDSEIDDIPVTPPPEPALPEVSNQARHRSPA